MKLVEESLFEFSKSNNPREILGIGRVGEIREFFRNLNISDEDYSITEHEILFNSHLDLSGYTSITNLPEGLNIPGYLDLEGCKRLNELPEELTIGGIIYIGSNQTKLEDYISNSKFKNKLRYA